MLLLWPSASMLLKHSHQETGSSKAFYSSSHWLDTILLHFSDSNVFGDYQACSLINCPLSIYWNLSANVLISSIDRVFPQEAFEDRSYAPQCSVCWTAELCEEVPVYETASWDVSKGICGLWELRLQHEAAGAAGRALLCKLLFSTRLTIFLEKFKLRCNHGGHYSGNGRKPVLSRGIFF